jgi:hypothetical protein
MNCVNIVETRDTTRRASTKCMLAADPQRKNSVSF